MHFKPFRSKLLKIWEVKRKKPPPSATIFQDEKRKRKKEKKKKKKSGIKIIEELAFDSSVWTRSDNEGWCQRQTRARKFVADSVPAIQPCAGRQCSSGGRATFARAHVRVRAHNLLSCALEISRLWLARRIFPSVSPCRQMELLCSWVRFEVVVFYILFCICPPSPLPPLSPTPPP